MPLEELFQGLTAHDLEPLHHLQRTVKGRSVTTKVVVDWDNFPLKPRSIVFDVGTMISLGSELKIESVGIVVKGAKRSTRVYIVEHRNSPTKVGELDGIGSSYLWIDPCHRYHPSDKQWEAYTRAVHEDRLRQSKVKKMARLAKKNASQ
jgi:hypothetical protein